MRSRPGTNGYHFDGFIREPVNLATICWNPGPRHPKRSKPKSYVESGVGWLVDWFVYLFVCLFVLFYFILSCFVLLVGTFLSRRNSPGCLWSIEICQPLWRHRGRARDRGSLGTSRWRQTPVGTRGARPMESRPCFGCCATLRRENLEVFLEIVDVCRVVSKFLRLELNAHILYILLLCVYIYIYSD